MSLIVPVSDQRKRLSEFLCKLSSLIEQEVIQSEANLEAFVQVETPEQIGLQLGRGYEKTPANATLLEILGYSYSDVENHPTKRVIIGQVKYAPDYILRPNHRPSVILDLKSPDVNIDHPKWTGQIYNYCRDENLPLGILFSGTSLRVFINVEYRGLTKYKEMFKGEPVATAENSNMRQMVDLLLRFSAASLDGNPLILARWLANQRKKEIKDRIWRAAVEGRLRSALHDPSEETLLSIAKIDSIWHDFDVKPSQKDLSGIWTAVKTRPVPSPRRRTRTKTA